MTFVQAKTGASAEQNVSVDTDASYGRLEVTRLPICANSATREVLIDLRGEGETLDALT
jgi:hypothetical protein